MEVILARGLVMGDGREMKGLLDQADTGREDCFMLLVCWKSEMLVNELGYGWDQ